MRHEIQQQVVALLVEQGYSPGQLTPATRFAEDLRLDWLHQLKLVERLEQHFGIDIAGSERQKMGTLRGAASSKQRRNVCIERKLDHSLRRTRPNGLTPA